jgi:RNA recognition motif-containing protein
MGNKLYVGNLPYKVRDNDLADLFSPYGEVASAKVMMERGTDRSKGFGFVEMADDAQAQAAIAGLHGQGMGGRPLVVNEARPLEPRPPRQFGDRGGNGGGGGGGFRSPYGDRGGDRGGYGDRGGRGGYDNNY